jgi:hypothetical protein
MMHAGRWVRAVAPLFCKHLSNFTVTIDYQIDYPNLASLAILRG